MNEQLKIVAISDTHNGHDSVIVPPCDILIHAGDESFRGKKEEIEAFAKWFDKQPAKHLVWIPGNHSLGVEKHWPNSKYWLQDISPRTNILMHSSVTIEGLKIWGSPVTPWFHDWAWNEIRGPAIKKYWDMIPNDTRIVVTHGPPFGILDTVNPGTLYEDHVGCKDLMNAIRLIEPDIHIFGHIHECSGILTSGKTTFINASIMDENYHPINPIREYIYEKI